MNLFYKCVREGRVMANETVDNYEKLASWGTSFLNIKNTDYVLDIGCGNGLEVRYLLRKAELVYGLDSSKVSLAVAADINKKAIDDGRCEILEGDVLNLPFNDDGLDVVTAFESVYFWEDLDAAFKEIYRVLIPGGHLLICNGLSQRQDLDVKKWAEMLDFEIYNTKYMVQMLNFIGYKAEYHADEKRRICIVAEKIKV